MLLNTETAVWTAEKGWTHYTQAKKQVTETSEKGEEEQWEMHGSL